MTCEISVIGLPFETQQVTHALRRVLQQVGQRGIGSMARIKVVELAEVLDLLQRVVECYMSQACEYQAPRNHCGMR